MEEMINGFNELKIQSTIDDYEYYDSEEGDPESDPNSNLKVATYTTNINPPDKLSINQFIPERIPGAIPTIDQKITEEAAGIEETLE